MKKIPVGAGKFALVDDEDYDYLSSFLWTTSTKYASLTKSNFYFISSTMLIYPGALMSRIILGLKYGDIRQADHINHNILDNQRTNLRVVTKAQNQYNQKVKIGGTSQYKGVCWNKRDKKWQASITIDGKWKYLGYFDSEEHAAHAYNLAARKYFKEYALLNKVG